MRGGKSKVVKKQTGERRGGLTEAEFTNEDGKEAEAAEGGGMESRGASSV